MMIESFVRGLSDVELVKEVCDDGYTGTDYERPTFKEMIAMVERGEIDCIIVKDLSRLGRESIGAGNYIQNYFPKKNVRFIAINDHYDSLTANSSEKYMIVPVKNFVNESYCKDNSIAQKLNEKGTFSPAEYKKASGAKYKTSFQRNPEAKWTPKAVLRILSNEIYIGVLEQGKREKVSYKVKKTMEKPKSAWVRVEHNHAHIITEADFNAVQELLKRDTRAEKAITVVLFWTRSRFILRKF